MGISAARKKEFLEWSVEGKLFTPSEANILLMNSSRWGNNEDDFLDITITEIVNICKGYGFNESLEKETVE
jgi:hypothetical protein